MRIASPVSFVMRLDPRRHIDSVTDDGELQPASPADRARDDRTGVDPDPDPQLVPERLPDLALDLTAAATAASAWRSSGCGAPNTASNPSPR